MSTLLITVQTGFKEMAHLTLILSIWKKGSLSGAKNSSMDQVKFAEESL